MTLFNDTALDKSRRRRYASTAIRVAMLLIPGALGAATYYVSPGGSDTSPGSSMQPFRTVARAVAAAAAGDTIILGNGTYGREGTGRDTSGNTINAPVVINKAGSPDAWIALKAASKWGAVLDCQDTATTPGCDAYISLRSGAAYWKIQDVVFTRGYWTGIHSNAGASHITIKGCKFEHIGQHANSSSYGATATGANGSSHDLIFDGNVFHDIGRTSGNYLSNDHALYLHSTNTTIVNNVFYRPISGWPIQVAAGFSGLIANNTFAFGHPTSNGEIMLWGQDGNITIRDNIFYRPLNSAIAVYGFSLNSGASCAIDHNLMYGVSSLLDSSTPCSVSSNAVADPQFENATTSAPYDFRLLPYSPAVNAGVPIPSVLTDFDGNPRPQNSAPDLGAFEHSAASTPPPLTFSLTPSSRAISLAKGQAAGASISATLVSGAPVSVTFSATSLPAGVTASFSQPTCAVTCSTMLTVSSSPAAASGTYAVAVRAAGGGVTASSTVNVTLTDPVVNPSGAAGWWKFDAGSGATVLDSSGNGNTGTFMGSPQWVKGPYGTALSFNGTTSYVTVKEGASINLSKQMTVSFWVQSANTPGIDQRIIGKLYSWEIKLNGRYPQLSAGGRYAALNYAVPAGSWQHVVFTFSSGTVKGYVNGAPVSTLTNTFTGGEVLPLEAYGLYIGTDAGRSYFTKGLLDDIRIYNRPLSASEVLSIYSQTRH